MTSFISGHKKRIRANVIPQYRKRLIEGRKKFIGIPRHAEGNSRPMQGRLNNLAIESGALGL